MSRISPSAPVSVPIRWDELDDPDLRPDRWTLRTVVDRVRIALRNGHRTRILSNHRGPGTADPEAAHRILLPSLLERRRRVDQALFAVVMEAYLHGVSSRKVDNLVKALGADTGISKSEVSRRRQS